MKEYLFLLGNTPNLSLAELRAVINQQAQLINSRVAQAETDLSPTEIIDRLGGTVKVFKPWQTLPAKSDNQSIIQIVASQLKTLHPTVDQKLNFYIAQIGKANLPKIDLHQVKTELKRLGLRSRFTPGKQDGLSAANLLHQDTLELNLIYTQNQGTLLAQTVAVQDIDRWTQRDRSRPYVQTKKGMLPLKTARMMVNLAVGPDLKNQTKLLDPFCGSGSILMEAASLGLTYLIGADNDPRSVQGTKANLNWLKQRFGLSFNFETHLQDATKLKLDSGKLDYLVSEPFLGKQTPQTQKLKQIHLGLEKLYLGSFKQWRELLKLNAKVVIIFPLWPAQPNLHWQNLIDKLAKLGYTTTSEPLIYGRSKAQVIRSIWQFKYTGK